MKPSSEQEGHWRPILNISMTNRQWSIKHCQHVADIIVHINTLREPAMVQEQCTKDDLLAWVTNYMQNRTLEVRQFNCPDNIPPEAQSSCVFT